LIFTKTKKKKKMSSSLSSSSRLQWLREDGIYVQFGTRPWYTYVGRDSSHHWYNLACVRKNTLFFIGSPTHPFYDLLNNYKRPCDVLQTYLTNLNQSTLLDFSDPLDMISFLCTCSADDIRTCMHRCGDSIQIEEWDLIHLNEPAREKISNPFIYRIAYASRDHPSESMSIYGHRDDRGLVIIDEGCSRRVECCSPSRARDFGFLTGTGLCPHEFPFYFIAPSNDFPDRWVLAYEQWKQFDPKKDPLKPTYSEFEEG
jgi:hypothetical protein